MDGLSLMTSNVSRRESKMGFTWNGDDRLATTISVQFIPAVDVAGPLLEGQRVLDSVDTISLVVGGEFVDNPRANVWWVLFGMPPGTHMRV